MSEGVTGARSGGREFTVKAADIAKRAEEQGYRCAVSGLPFDPVLWRKRHWLWQGVLKRAGLLALAVSSIALRTGGSEAFAYVSLVPEKFVSELVGVRLTGHVAIFEESEDEELFLTFKDRASLSRRYELYRGFARAIPAINCDDAIGLLMGAVIRHRGQICSDVAAKADSSYEGWTAPVIDEPKFELRSNPSILTGWLSQSRHFEFRNEHVGPVGVRLSPSNSKRLPSIAILSNSSALQSTSSAVQSGGFVSENSREEYEENVGKLDVKKPIGNRVIKRAILVLWGVGGTFAGMKLGGFYVEPGPRRRRVRRLNSIGRAMCWLCPLSLLLGWGWT